MTKEPWLQSVWPVGLGLLLTGALIFATTQAEAIPVAGDYIFTRGLTGTFTSTGTGLSEWSFIDPLNPRWTNTSSTQNVLENDQFAFAAADISVGGTPLGITVVWASPAFAQGFLASTGIVSTNGPIEFQLTDGVQPVPEPRSAFLTASGLLLLLGYWWRQRHKAGMHVG